jgi:hypothetical protein
MTKDAYTVTWPGLGGVFSTEEEYVQESERFAGLTRDYSEIEVKLLSTWAPPAAGG